MKGVRKGNKTVTMRGGGRCYASGGRVANDMAESAASKMGMSGAATDEGDAGMIDGGPARSRMDRAVKKPATTNVNIIVASGKGNAEPAGAGAPPPMPPPMPAPMPKPPMAAPAMAPMPGGPPMAAPAMPMRASGGRVTKPYKEGVASKVSTLGSMAKRAVQGKPFVSSTQSEPTCTTEGGCDVVTANRAMRGKFGAGRKHGGRVMAKGEGAGGGLGRLDKIKDYGAKAGKPAKGE